MRSWKAMCEAIHLTALGVWLGVLVMTGAAAAVLFPTTKSLQPRLPGYEAYTGEHWRIAAGVPAAKLFGICDSVQLVCGMIGAVSLLTLVTVAKARWRRPAMLVRIGALALALAALGYQLFFLAPGMTTNLASFWAAAAQGQNEVAEKFRAAFDAAHPTASAALSASAAAVLLALFAGGWAATTHESADASTGRHATSGGKRGEGANRAAVKMETPMLARSKG